MACLRSTLSLEMTGHAHAALDAFAYGFALHEFAACRAMQPGSGDHEHTGDLAEGAATAPALELESS